MPRKRLPRRGDLVQVHWVDITADPAGDPDHPVPIHRTTVGLWWDWKEFNGKMYIVTTDTVDKDSSRQSGYTIYPEGVVDAIVVVKRK